MAAPRTHWMYTYSNNRIESFNKEIKRNCKVHVQWVAEVSEKLFLVTLFIRYNCRIGKRLSSPQTRLQNLRMTSKIF